MIVSDHVDDERAGTPAVAGHSPQMETPAAIRGGGLGTYREAIRGHRINTPFLSSPIGTQTSQLPLTRRGPWTTDAPIGTEPFKVLAGHPQSGGVRPDRQCVVRALGAL